MQKHEPWTTRSCTSVISSAQRRMQKPADHCAAILRSSPSTALAVRWNRSRPTDTVHRSVPSKNDILVPETLLKKRKSQEKDRAEKATQRDAKKKV